MTGDLDGGPIYFSKTISLEGTLSEIFRRINIVTNELIIKICKDAIEPRAQRGTPVIFKRLSEKDNEILPTFDLIDFYNHIRMLDHESYPNEFLKFGDFKLEFFKVCEEQTSIIAKCKITKCT